MLTAPDFKQKQIVFAMLSRGERLSFKNDNVIVKDSEGRIKHQSTCYRLFALFVAGHASITTGLLQRAEKFGFSIVLMTHGLRVYGLWANESKGNVILRRKQYNHENLNIAAHIVKNKITNQIAALKKIRPREVKRLEAAEKLMDYLASIEDCKKIDLQSLLGTEGIASRIYFQTLFDEMNWKARRPRVKHDTTNCLLDIGYTYLFNIVEALLSIYGFDLYCGVYHREFYQRKSLVCDLVEPMRPLIDLRIRKAHRLGQIRISDFYVKQGRHNLFGKNAGPYTSLILKELINHKQEMFIYIQSYYRAFMRNKPANEFPVFTI
ncbi:CRISPR-associated endonuclease Cas1 [Limihaloglobus sulfuriphilus]|uniref:CRISPR-associated endonuclease Cas1 n=1 Tax=Limihaloglobus sulfuriphilus TaxID=1851148 RepID=A0A1Q2MG00_9BACT|nr:type V CRISPR-associated endonuclease Cas1 [Limihaloglobus sulfuriphilus]AQQ71625.1 CRISPR-associated endonuclease Cas1 [Limihaloglobus sulfuriphilus]